MQQVFICFHPNAITSALGKVNIVLAVAAYTVEIANRTVFTAGIAIAFYTFTAYVTAGRREGNGYDKRKNE